MSFCSKTIASLTFLHDSNLNLHWIIDCIAVLRAKATFAVLVDVLGSNPIPLTTGGLCASFSFYSLGKYLQVSGKYEISYELCVWILE